jgi:hypothetical protein
MSATPTGLTVTPVPGDPKSLIANWNATATTSAYALLVANAPYPIQPTINSIVITGLPLPNTAYQIKVASIDSVTGVASAFSSGVSGTTVATPAATPNSTLSFKFGTGINDQDVLATFNDAFNYRGFTVHVTVGTAIVQATLDGSTWVTIDAEDKTSTTPGTRVATLTVGKIGYVAGTFTGFRVLQSGASATTAFVQASDK